MPLAQKIAEDNPELIEIIRELQEKVISLEKENLKLRERLITLEDIQKSEKLCRFYTGFPNYGTFKALFDYLKMQLLPKGTGEEEKLPIRVTFLTDFKQNLVLIQN